MSDLDEVFDAASRYFALLAEPTRLRILHRICEGECTVSEIISATGGSQTNISRHLNAMFRVGVLTRRRDRNFTWYGVADPMLTEICRTVCVHLASRDIVRGEVLPFQGDLAPPLRRASQTLRGHS